MNTVPADDWRRQGQEDYLVGLAFKLMPWTSTNPSWDHDHCEFCGAKIAPETILDALHKGYSTLDLKHWICFACFHDFREEFRLAEAK